MSDKYKLLDDKVILSGKNHTRNDSNSYAWLKLQLKNLRPRAHDGGVRGGVV